MIPTCLCATIRTDFKDSKAQFVYKTEKQWCGCACVCFVFGQKSKGTIEAMEGAYVPCTSYVLAADSCQHTRRASALLYVKLFIKSTYKTISNTWHFAHLGATKVLLSVRVYFLLKPEYMFQKRKRKG